jgi:hypothetical protein
MGMRIYVPEGTEHGEWALPVESSSFSQVHGLADLGRPAAAEWEPFEVRLVRKLSGRAFKESDFPWLASGVMVWRRAAVEALSGFLGNDAELLPLRCADAELNLVNVWRSLDALDTARSKVEKYKSSGGIMRIVTHRFRDEIVDDHAFFRLSAMPHGDLFVQQVVVEAARAAGLRETGFKLVSAFEEPAEQWRRPPESVSIADMAAASDEELWSILYLALISRVNGSADEQYATVKRWTKGLQMLWATQLVDDEVNNGGFNQYFFNSSGQFAIEAVEGLELIGAHKRAQVVQRAIDQLFTDAPQLRRY